MKLKKFQEYLETRLSKAEIAEIEESALREVEQLKVSGQATLSVLTDPVPRD